MTSKFVFSFLIFLSVIILFIISKLNRAIKLLNNRVNIHSSLIKRLKNTSKKEDKIDPDEELRHLIEKDFG